MLKNFLDYQDYIPKSVVCYQEGYNKKFFFDDLCAGFTVGIIAIPLAMAFAIGSGVSPERGLFTAIIAGFLISLLGGSRVQIGGPTGAFVVIVYSIIERYGYEGLIISTLIGGILMILMGLFRFGILLKFIPYPVTTGFTTGIALVIFTSQMKDFFGLSIASQSNDFVEKCLFCFKAAHTFNGWALAISLGTLIMLVLFKNYYPKLPGAIIAIGIGTIFVYLFDLPVETIEKKFGLIPNMLPAPHLPSMTLDKIQLLFPSAIAIAMLASLESLLSAVVADGMTGTRHRSNCELVAQGIANIFSVIFGGIPATGAIARTTANIKMQAKTPVAGIIHAVTILILMLFFAPAAAKVPLPALAAVLVFVAWNMSELEHFFEILLKNPKSDALVLLTTFFLTVLVDLAVAVQVGVVLAAVLFLKKMTDSTTISLCKVLLHDNLHEHPEFHDSDIIFRKDVPEQVTVFEINGPFFFGIADSLNEALRQESEIPKVFILRMRKVPLIDATGIKALKQFHHKCCEKGITFLLSGVRKDLRAILKKTSVEKFIGSEHIFDHLNQALAYSQQLLKKENSNLR